MEYCEQNLQKKHYLYNSHNHGNRKTASEYELGLYHSGLRDDGIKRCDSDGYVSRDSGLDLDSGSRSNIKLDELSDTDITMRDPIPQDLVTGQGQSCLGYKHNNDYDGGCLIHWRAKAGNRDSNADLQQRGSAHFRNSLHWDEFFGSSLDLTPTLLGIYDKIASASRNGDPGPINQSECDYFLTDELLQDGSDNHCHSPKSSPPLGKRTIFRHSESHDLQKSINRVEWDDSVEDNNNKIKMESAERKLIQEESDTKKRPLSLSSMSSSSSSSLPRKTKRPNLSDYVDVRDGGLDIEKLDNILYIDDSPEGELSELAEDRTEDDDLSLYSEEKRKSGGDSDSQFSADQSSNYGDQSENLNSTLSLHQSDSSLSYTPSTSANCSTADLSVQSDLSVETLKQHKPSRTPSRSSSSSMKQSSHYVSYVQRVVAEIIETERIYVKNLEDIKVGYYQYILENPRLGITVPERKYLFGNIVEIHNYSCDFLQELEECGMDPIRVAECFLRNNESFVIYADYCTNYPSAVAVLTKVMHDPQLSEMFKQRQIAMGHSLPIGAYLLKPVQRVLKYHLLLQNILKHYNKGDPGYEKLSQALDHMTDMSHQINEMKRKHEHAVRVQEIQSQLEDYEGEDFTRLGELVLEGSFRMYGVKASRQIFLFERGVIIAKRKEDGMWSCKAYIPCATLMLVESIPKEPLNFQILPFDNPRGAHTIHSRNLDQKRKWCQEIKRLILESYSSKIPDSVKDLVMEKLGKSKEEDDFDQQRNADPGKSHVTTPDYLEKRLKTRRKSGPALIQEILKPQRARKIQQGRPRAESGGPGSRTMQALESLLYNKDVHRNTTNEVEHTGYRSYIPGIFRGDKQNQENQYHGNEKQKRPISVQRSQSFQSSSDKSKRKSMNYPKEHPIVNDSMSMDNLSQSEGSAIRTNSFRMATRISPIRLDSKDDVDGRSRDNENVNSVLTDQTNLENIPPAIKRSIDRELNKQRYSFSVKDAFLNGHNQENLDGSYLEETRLRKRGRYASMPVLNASVPGSPKSLRLASEGSTPRLDNSDPSKSPHLKYKEVNVKPYFMYNSSSRLPSANDPVQVDLSRPGDSKHINAFNDAFANLRKSQETLDNGSVGTKPLTLTQPKPFTSTLKTSANFLSSQAKLNKWGSSDRFTKGSLSDLSHLKEDPWIRDKQRSYTESNIKPPAMVQKHVNSGESRNQDKHMFEKPMNKQVSRLSMDIDSYRHDRIGSVSSDDRTFSRDNLDWFVYANRNSLPVSGFSMDDMNRSYKYCTPPRDAMVPPTGPLAKNGAASFVTPPRQVVDKLNSRGYPHDGSVSNADSSVSLSATNSSSETCSSPDILKDGVFDDALSTSSPYHRDRSALSRSFSSPEGQRSSKMKARRHLQDDRPASADILEDMSHIDASERLVAEMESYMQRSSSSSGSGSISSSNNINRFPTSIPSFERKEETRNKNRDSCISTGSASSYESAGPDETRSDTEEGLVDAIKSKFHNITSKIAGKKGTTDQPVSSQEPNSHPSKYKQEDHPAKILPSISHNFSLRLRSGSKATEPDLPTILKEKEPGSQAIGARMANTDLDDYATFSLPRSHHTENIENQETPKTRNVHKQYGRYSNSNLVTTSFSPTPTKSQFKSQSTLAVPLTPLQKSENTQQADSAFSIQSVDIDSSSIEDSPRDDSSDSSKGKTKPDKGEPADTYERRLSAVFNSDEAFRDSAVYDIDDIDSPPPLSTADVTFPSHHGDTSKYTTSAFVPSKVPIKAYVQQLEEKNKVKSPLVMKVKQKEPSSAIKQKIESLAASSEYHSKSSSISRSMSTTTSRTHSRSSSRASSEEKHVPLTSAALKEYIDNKFPMDGETSEGISFRSRSNSTGSLSNMKAALSIGKLNQMTSETDNLVVMKGWVKELIGKFQDK